MYLATQCCYKEVLEPVLKLQDQIKDFFLKKSECQAF